MPRKQRFKPSRKPKNADGVVPSQQVSSGKDASPEHREMESQAPVRNDVRDIESDRD